MKLSDVRPCDCCHGKIAPVFNVVRISVAVFKPQATHTVMGMSQMLGGSLALAEVLAPDDEAVSVAMDEKEHKSLMVELIICNTCYTMKDINLAMLAEIRQSQIDKQKVSNDNSV